MMNPLWLRRTHLVTFLVGMVVWSIALLSPIPEEDAKRVLRSKEGIFYFGKTLHIVAYLCLTVFAGVMHDARHSWGWWAFALFIHGGLIELLQPHFGRTGRWEDWALDTLGVVFGCGLVFIWWRWVAANANRGGAAVLEQHRTLDSMQSNQPEPH
jgi:VanZ family protein